METKTNLDIVWSKLPFLEFPAEILEQRRVPWQKKAKEIMGLLETGNTVLTGKTSVGKTVVALLALITSNYQRQLIVAPAKVLVDDQHLKLLQKILGERNIGQSVTGDTKAERRRWNEYTSPYIFVTPETALNDCLAGRLNLSSFDILVADEIQDARGNHAYLKLLKLAMKQGVRILGLSPDFGDDEDTIKLIVLLKLVDVNDLAISTPHVTESLIKTPLTPELKTIEAILFSITIETAEQLNPFLQSIEQEIPTDRILRQKEIGFLREEIEKHQAKFGDDDGWVSSLSARYGKLAYAYRIVLTEGYDTFDKFVKNLEWQWEHKKTWAARHILENPSFKEVVAIVQQNQGKHPKLLAFLENQLNLLAMQQKILTYVNVKNTADALKNALGDSYFQQSGNRIRIETLFGGQNKAGQTRQKQVLDDLACGNIPTVISTSVTEKGLNLPEVDVIYHYSMPPTRLSRIQRSGRTGRTKPGSVIFLCLDHLEDLIFYWVTKPHKRKGNQTLDLFEDYYSPAEQLAQNPPDYIH